MDVEAAEEGAARSAAVGLRWRAAVGLHAGGGALARRVAWAWRAEALQSHPSVAGVADAVDPAASWSLAAAAMPMVAVVALSAAARARPTV